MKRNLTVTVVSLALLSALFVGSVLASRKVEALRGKEATLEEILYVPSGKVLKRMSLGYSSLLADIYWTRAVQYFGARFDQGSTRYDLLAPLLDITTDLDPHLIAAYQTGAIFLSQRPPQGAGQPDKAVALVEKGIRDNPEYWRLYFTLGFIQYMDRRDYKAAEEAFEKGSEVPGALVWMKVMAARMAEHGGDIGTAMTLWRGIYEANSDKQVRQNAINHLISLQADAEIGELEQRVRYFQKKTGSLPSRWSDLVSERLLPAVPQDPTGTAYVLAPDGTVQVQDRSKFPFLGEFLQEQAQEKHH